MVNKQKWENIAPHIPHVYVTITTPCWAWIFVKREMQESEIRDQHESQRDAERWRRERDHMCVYTNARHIHADVHSFWVSMSYLAAVPAPGVAWLTHWRVNRAPQCTDTGVLVVWEHGASYRLMAKLCPPHCDMHIFHPTSLLHFGTCNLVGVRTRHLV